MSCDCLLRSIRGAKDCDTRLCMSVCLSVSLSLRLHISARNSSEDEIANVNFYDDIAHVLQNAKNENLLRLAN